MEDNVAKSYSEVDVILSKLDKKYYDKISKEFLNFESDEKKLKIINSIVNTLTNLKEINSITFSINGEKNEKLSEIYLKNI